MAGQPFNLGTAKATVESAIVKIEKQTMRKVMRENPALSEKFMSYLLSRNTQIEAELVDHLFNSSEKRLARILLLLAHTTRSRISFFMNKFRKLGFIDYNGTLNVNTSLMNVIVHD